MNTRIRLAFSLAVIVLTAAVLVVAASWRASEPGARLAGARAAPAATASVSLVPASATAVAGEALTLTIQAAAAESLGGWELLLRFDPAAIELEAVTAGEFLGSTGRTPGSLGPLGAGGEWMVGGYSHGSDVGVTGSGVLAYVRLLPLSEGSATVAVSQTLLATVTGTVVTEQPSVGQGAQLTIAAPRLVSAGRQAGDVILSWQHQDRYTGYEVWRHTAPYFAAGGPPATLIASGLPPAPGCTQNGDTITCTDAGAIGGGEASYYYVVRGLRPSGGRVSFNRTGKFDVALQPGE
ncbi:MAG: hypothetical protein FJ011_01720 [Chloroflexi bacterium]|nr:hypothetical protein [Chloroflexota bacterium]